MADRLKDVTDRYISFTKTIVATWVPGLLFCYSRGLAKIHPLSSHPAQSLACMLLEANSWVSIETAVACMYSKNLLEATELIYHS